MEYRFGFKRYLVDKIGLLSYSILGDNWHLAGNFYLQEMSNEIEASLIYSSIIIYFLNDCY